MYTILTFFKVLCVSTKLSKNTLCTYLFN
uniref:Uncharacterized protein n=1 Tax=Arundo donax TaxID=35708 RepID=A0A0A8YAS4_ARUDO